MVRRRIPAAPPDPPIREGTPADIPFVRELSRQAFDQFGDYGEFLPSYLEHPSVFTVIALHQGRPVGFLMLALVASSRVMPWEEQVPEAEVLDAEVLAIAVLEEFHGQGHGTRLLQHAVTSAQSWHQVVGVRSVQLNVAHTNHPALTFFRKMGFIEVDPEDGVYPRGQRSIRMARPVTQ